MPPPTCTEHVVYGTNASPPAARTRLNTASLTWMVLGSAVAWGRGAGVGVTSGT